MADLDRKIDREAAGALALNQHPGGVFAIAPRSMGEVMEFAKLMSVSGVCVRPIFRGNPGACLAVAVQAMKWGADPFAVANKAYVVKNRAGEETIAYEAQLIHAIVNSSPVLQRRLRPVFEGQGAERRCRIVGWVKGENELLDYQSPPIRAIAVKNSPLWQADPDQQLFYYSTRAWARRHVPEILLGIYAQDDFQGDTVEHEPVPAPRREDFKDELPAEPETEFEVIDTDGAVRAFTRGETALDALHQVLEEAARLGSDRLTGCWDDNQAALAELECSGFSIESVVALHAHLSSPPAKERPRQAVQQPDAPSPPVADATGGRRVPRDVPQQRELTVGVGVPETAATPDTATTDASPSESAPRQSQALDMVMTGGQRNYPTWVRARLIPRMRRQRTSDDMAWFMGDNDEMIEGAKRYPDLRREIEAAAAEQWRVIGELEARGQ